MKWDHSNGKRISPYHGEPVHMLIDDLLVNMSRADRSELSLLAFGKPEHLLSEAIRASVYSFGYCVDGCAAVMGGLKANGLVWMVASTEILEDHKKAFLHYSCLELKTMQWISPDHKLRVGIDRRWRKSLRWLKWLGFFEIGTFELRGRLGVNLELGNARTLGPVVSHSYARGRPRTAKAVETHREAV